MKTFDHREYMKGRADAETGVRNEAKRSYEYLRGFTTATNEIKMMSEWRLA